jgi:hypothetical protein
MPPRPSDGEAGAARADLARALARLDAYSFFTVPADASSGGDLVVLGTTGAFLVKACGLRGVALVEGRRPLVGEAAVPGLRALRSGAKKLSHRLRGAGLTASVEPVVCLTQAIAPSAAQAAGVRFVRVADVAHDLSARPGLQSHTRAQRAARALGMQVAGDRKRHFAIRSEH